MPEWLPSGFWIFLAVATVIAFIVAVRKFGKRRLRKKRVKVGDRWAYFITIDGGKQWFQVYWDEKGIGHVMREPNQEAVAVLVERLTKKEARHTESAGKPRDDFWEQY